MAEIIDIVHKLSYIADDAQLKGVTGQLGTQLDRVDQLTRRQKALQDAYDRTAKGEIDKREKIVKLIKQTQAALEKEGDAVEDIVLNNKQLNDSYQKQVGIVGALENKMRFLEARRDRAFDPARIAAYNKQLERAGRDLGTARGTTPGNVLPPNPQTPNPESGGGGLFGSIVGGNIVANLMQRAGSAILEFGTDVVATTQKYEKFNALLSNTLGGRAAGAAAFEMLAEFAAKTPFQLDELTGAYIKLVNRGIKPTKEELTAFGDIAASQGKSFDQFVEAVLDGVTGEFERLKEFGIRAKQVGDNVTLSFGNVSKTVPKSAEAIKRALLEIRNEAPGIAGAMAVVSKTIEGQISNIGDGFDRLKATIGESFKGQIVDAISFVGDFVSTLNSLIDVPITEKIEAERVEINSLVLALTDANLSETERQRIMAQLNHDYPELLRNIELEQLSTKSLLSFLDSVNASYAEKIRLGGLKSELDTQVQNAEKNSAKLGALSAKLNVELSKLGFTNSEIVNIIGKDAKEVDRIITERNRSLQSNSSGLKLVNGQLVDTRKALTEIRELTAGGFGGLTSGYDDLVAKQTELNKGVAQQRDLLNQTQQQSKEFIEGRKAELRDAIKDLKTATDALVASGKVSFLGGSTTGPNTAFGAQVEQLSKETVQYRKNIAEIERLQASLAGFGGDAITKPGALNTPAAKKAVKVDPNKPFNDAITAENDRFAKELAQLETKYNQQRLAARKQFADDDVALNAELLRIKEAQEAETFLITTEKEKAHQRNLLAIYKRFKGLQSVEYAKGAADIAKAQETEAARLLAITNRTEAERIAAIKKAIAEEEALRKKALDRLAALEAENLARNNDARNTALLGANVIAGGGSIDPRAEAAGASAIRLAGIKIPTARKAEAYAQLSADINSYFDQRALQIQITAIDVKLANANLNLSDEDRAKLEAQRRALEVQLAQKKTETVKKQPSFYEYYAGIADAAKTAADIIIEQEQRMLDAQIAAQEKRVTAAQRIAERGNAELLQLEEERLAELERKRAKAAQTEMLINQALALSNAIVAVAKAAAQGAGQGGYGAIATVAATIGALVAGYALVRTAISDNPGFKDGVVNLQGPGNDRSDSIPARLSRGESVLTAAATRHYGEDMLRDMNALRYNVAPVVFGTQALKEITEAKAAEAANYKNDFKALQKEMRALKNAIEGIPGSSMTIDAQGVAAINAREFRRQENLKNL